LFKNFCIRGKKKNLNKGKIKICWWAKSFFFFFSFGGGLGGVGFFCCSQRAFPSSSQEVVNNVPRVPDVFLQQVHNHS